MSKTVEVKCNGIVTSRLLNIASMIEYAHDDGRICARPGPVDLAVGTLVESEFTVEYGLCEHTILAVHDITTTEPEEKPLTVTDILQARSTAPDDEPVSQDVIQRAKIPPRIKSNPSTAPARDITNVPVENRYEYDLSEEELRELNSIRDDGPISTGKPMNPFAQEFDASRKPAATPVRRGNKPTSVFDL